MSGPDKESAFLKILSSFFVSLTGSYPTWYSLKLVDKGGPNLPELMNLSYEEMIFFFMFAASQMRLGSLFQGTSLDLFLLVII